MFAMSRHGAFHECFRRSHKTNETPHIALAGMALLMFSIVAFFSGAMGMAALDDSTMPAPWALSDSWEPTP